MTEPSVLALILAVIWGVLYALSLATDAGRSLPGGAADMAEYGD